MGLPCVSFPSDAPGCLAWSLVGGNDSTLSWFRWPADSAVLRRDGPGLSHVPPGEVTFRSRLAVQDIAVHRSGDGETFVFLETFRPPAVNETMVPGTVGCFKLELVPGVDRPPHLVHLVDLEVPGLPRDGGGFFAPSRVNAMAVTETRLAIGGTAHADTRLAGWLVNWREVLRAGSGVDQSTARMALRSRIPLGKTSTLIFHPTPKIPGEELLVAGFYGDKGSPGVGFYSHLADKPGVWEETPYCEHVNQVTQVAYAPGVDTLFVCGGTSGMGTGRPRVAALVLVTHPASGTARKSHDALVERNLAFRSLLVLDESPDGVVIFAMTSRGQLYRSKYRKDVDEVVGLDGLALE